ncbi:MAG TPA: M12 family metallo-peptidase [Steroidobacter sp.]
MRGRHVVSAGWWGCVASLLVPALALALEAGSSARILHAEVVRPIVSDPGSASQKTNASQTRHLRFDAYGRRFEIALEPNTQLKAQLKMSASDSRLELYRGELEGLAGSWVRLAGKNGELSGMIWDGTDLYVVEPAAEIAEALVEPGISQATGTLIFRLKDTLIESGAASCAAEADGVARKGDEAFQSLLHELKGTLVSMQGTEAWRGLSLAALADASFLQKSGTASSARDAILARLNNVDGIFSSQLGIRINVGEVIVHDVTSDPFSNATSPGSLLAELGRLRKSSQQLRAHGLAHLFTGRDLDGSTIGIAYLDALCDAEYGAGLTEARSGWLDSLVAAHEIGHNFGADHDGDPNGSCSDTPSSGYLMAASVTGTDQFSQCSLNRMRLSADRASCITALPPANVAISSELPEVHEAVGTSFAWSLDVTNAGGLIARNVRAELTLPPALVVEDAWVVGGSCTSGGGIVQCLLGDLAGGASRPVNLTLRSDVLGVNSVLARVFADNDSTTSDNSGEGRITIDPEADLELTVDAPESVRTDASFAVQFSISNRAPIEAAGVRITIELPASVSVQSASLSAAACNVTTGQIECSIGTLAAGATVTGEATLIASSSGTAALLATVSGDYVDPNGANDSVQLSIAVSGGAPATSEAASDGGSGGGGSMSWLLLGLAALRGLRRKAAGRAT